jgi:hypothetical protein
MPWTRIRNWQRVVDRVLDRPLRKNNEGHSGVGTALPTQIGERGHV